MQTLNLNLTSKPYSHAVNGLLCLQNAFKSYVRTQDYCANPKPKSKL